VVDAGDDLVLLERDIALFFLVDTSRSMGLPLSQCTGQASCPTRLDVVRGAMRRFFEASEALKTPVGLVTFPAVDGAAQCSVWRGEAVRAQGVPLAPTAHAAVLARLQTARAAGESPVGQAASGLSEDIRLNPTKRPAFVVLLTDDAPNCNTGNLNATCVGTVPACRCTLGNRSLAACQSRDAGAGSFLTPCTQGCDDGVGAVDGLRTLRMSGSPVFVVSVDAPAEAVDSLNLMGRNGGAPAACPDGRDWQCGYAAPCNRANNRCAKDWYPANSEDALLQTLNLVRRRAATGR
jgi:hypothetical protein